jgi:hypothetical protein
MTPTDYEFPVWFWDSETTDEERHVWMTQERCRRQAMRQRTAYRRRVEKQKERAERRAEASGATVDAEDYR